MTLDYTFERRLQLAREENREVIEELNKKNDKLAEKNDELTEKNDKLLAEINRLKEMLAGADGIDKKKLS